MSAKELGHVRSTAEKVEAALNTIKNAGCHDVDAFYLSPSKEDLEAAVVEAALDWRRAWMAFCHNKVSNGKYQEAAGRMLASIDALREFLGEDSDE